MKGLEQLECFQERASRLLKGLYNDLSGKVKLKDLEMFRLKTLHTRYAEVLL